MRGLGAWNFLQKRIFILLGVVPFFLSGGFLLLTAASQPQAPLPERAMQLLAAAGLQTVLIYLHAVVPIILLAGAVWLLSARLARITVNFRSLLSASSLSSVCVLPVNIGLRMVLGGALAGFPVLFLFALTFLDALLLFLFLSLGGRETTDKAAVVSFLYGAVSLIPGFAALA